MRRSFKELNCTGVSHCTCTCVTDVSSCVIESAYIMYTLNIPVAETGITAKRKNLVSSKNEAQKKENKLNLKYWLWERNNLHYFYSLSYHLPQEGVVLITSAHHVWLTSGPFSRSQTQVTLMCLLSTSIFWTRLLYIHTKPTQLHWHAQLPCKANGEKNTLKI